MDALAKVANSLPDKWRAMKDAQVKQEIDWVKRLIQVRHDLDLPPIQTERIGGKIRYRIGGASCWASGLPDLVRGLEAERGK